MHLCILVDGHSAATAEANPEPPSVTTTSGGAIVLSRALHASEVSARARYQDSTCSSVHAISTHRPRSRCMPSTKTTRWIGNPFLDKFQRVRPAFLNSTGLM